MGKHRSKKKKATKKEDTLSESLIALRYNSAAAEIDEVDESTEIRSNSRLGNFLAEKCGIRFIDTDPD